MKDASKYVTANADVAVYNKTCILDGLVVMPDGTNDVTLTVYDNTAGSGSKALPTFTFAGNGGAQALVVPSPVIMANGIYVDITTAGTVEFTVMYRVR